MPEYEVLQDDPHRRVVRVGDTVRRPMHPWSASVHELLRHLAEVGFPYSPRVLGVDEAGREVLSYVAGVSCPDFFGQAYLGSIHAASCRSSNSYRTWCGVL